MNTFLRMIGAGATFFALPYVAFAQTGINTAYITPYTNGIINVINGILVPVLIAIAFIVFLYGVFKYFIYGAADDKSRADGRQFVLWGIIGFAVILSVWGLVNVVMSTLGLGVGRAPTPPTFTTSGSQTTPPPPPSASNPFPTAGQGESTINAGLGATTVTPDQQAKATAAYQACQASCTGSNCGQQCQDAYAQALGQTSSSSATPNPK